VQSGEIIVNDSFAGERERLDDGGAGRSGRFAKRVWKQRQRDRGGGKVVAEQLRKSFDKAEEPIKQQTAEAVAALLAKDYVRAVGNMSQVVRKQRTLDPAQKKALDELVSHTRKAAERDPQVNTPQLFKANMDLQLLLYPLD